MTGSGPFLIWSESAEAADADAGERASRASAQFIERRAYFIIVNLVLPGIRWTLYRNNEKVCQLLTERGVRGGRKDGFTA